MRTLPGFKLDEDGWGHVIQSPSGRVHIRGARVNDEVFASEKFGLLNISNALRNIPAGVPGVIVPIDEGLRQNVARIDIDQAHAMALTISERDEPILMLIGAGGVHVIDGSHRIARRIADRCPNVEAHFIPPGAMAHMRVRQYRETSPGKWLADDFLSEADFQKELSGALEYFEVFKAMNGLRP
jgi:hypothetical protein